MSKRGRPALGESKRTVKVSPHFTASEAARLDAVRGDTDRAVLAREAVLREVRKREVRLARAAKVARDAVTVGAWVELDEPYLCVERSHLGKSRAPYAAFCGRTMGWDAYDANGQRIGHGPETGPEGQRLADAALRAAGYVLTGEVAP